MIATPLAASSVADRLDDRRLGEARADRVEADALLGQQRAERAGEPDDRVLVGGVERVVGDAGQAGQRGRRDDRAAAARAQRRQHGVRCRRRRRRGWRPSRAGSSARSKSSPTPQPLRDAGVEVDEVEAAAGLDARTRPPRGWRRGRRRRRRPRARRPRAATARAPASSRSARDDDRARLGAAPARSRGRCRSAAPVTSATLPASRLIAVMRLGALGQPGDRLAERASGRDRRPSRRARAGSCPP